MNHDDVSYGAPEPLTTEEAAELANVSPAMTDRLPPKCPECNDTGERDSGGTHPWGEPIYLACDCKDAEIGRRWRTDNSLEAWFPITAQQLRKQDDEIDRLTRELAELKADRDSWIEQASQRAQETVEAMQQVEAYRLRCEALHRSLHRAQKGTARCPATSVDGAATIAGVRRVPNQVHAPTARPALHRSRARRWR